MRKHAVPRALIAALRGGEGKTMLAVGLTAAWRRRGWRVAPFKKGPDFIDAAWLSVAAGCPCRNLDLFLMKAETITRSFAAAASSAEAALIEGNRGLYDGVDAAGTYSTAELAKQLQAPVILIVDGTKSTRTVAASVLGCQRLDPEVLLRGVVLNQVAGRRHESVLREAIAGVCGLPVLGAIPRLDPAPFWERHLGLLPPQEHDGVAGAVQAAADIVEKYTEVEALWRVALAAPLWDGPDALALPGLCLRPVVRIGVFRDKAFQFYYPENLEALARAGARLVEISPIADADLPAVDGLYIGGGFPETCAAELARNTPFRTALLQRIEAGLPIYAECGGAVYLGKSLVVEGHEYPMVGALPATFGFGRKPQGHGYTTLEALGHNPFFAPGEILRGHEFHYTYLRPERGVSLDFAFRVLRGYGFDGKSDGLCVQNVLACYTHVHALGVESWAAALVRQALRFKAAVVPAHAGGDGCGITEVGRLCARAVPMLSRQLKEISEHG